MTQPPEIIIDESIYNSWPSVLDGCFIVIDEDKSKDNVMLLVVKSSLYPESSINNIDSFKEYYNDQVMAYMKWWYDQENSVALVTAINVNEKYRNNGIATFLCILSRTWVAENREMKISAEDGSVFPEVKHILDNIIDKYGENTDPYVSYTV